MRYAALSLVLLFTSLGFQPPQAALAQEDGLTAEEKGWLDKVVSAGWSGKSVSDDVSISARSAPMMDDHLKTVLAKDKLLTEQQRNALLEGVRIEVKNPGWLKHFAVTPGTYTVGFRQGANNLQTVVRDPDGNVVDVGGMTLGSGTQKKPITSRYFKDGQIKLEVKWGEVTFSWYYVSKQAHDNALGTCTERRAGNVSIYSDLPDEAGIADIAELCSKAVAINEKLMGGTLPKGFRYEVYLLGNNASYTDIDKLLTGGAFARNGAFTSHLTGLGYLWYYPHWDGDYGLPSSWLEVIIHEFHHQYIYKAVPELMLAPDWFQESCAEVAAQMGLDAVDKTAAANYRNRRLAELVFCDRNGQLPPPQDILGDQPSDSITGFYTGAWVIGEALAAQPKDLLAMIQAMVPHQLAWKQEEVLRREFDARYPTIDSILRAKLEAARKTPAGWIKDDCCVDEREGVVEINCAIGSAGFALVNTPIDGDTFALSGELQFDDQPSPQIDFILCYGAGSKEKHYLKIALLPAKAVLFENDNGDWRTLYSFTYDTNLEVTDAKGKLVWHNFKLVYDAIKGEARLDIGADGRYAKFNLSDYHSARDSYVGVGVYDGVAWFRKLKLE
ncbi:MAG: hypothetical protein R3E76_03590 [Planctomycetota bacterium]